MSKAALAAEVDELRARFPDTRLVYIGDKTFGQSREAVRNLIEVFADRPGYRFIVQTHVMQVRPPVIEAMRELGVVAVELGFESGDSEMLKSLGKLRALPIGALDVAEIAPRYDPTGATAQIAARLLFEFLFRTDQHDPGLPHWRVADRR